MKRITIYSFVVILFAFIFAGCAAAPAAPSTSGFHRSILVNAPFRYGIDHAKGKRRFRKPKCRIT